MTKNALLKRGPKIRAWVDPPPHNSGNARKKTFFFNWPLPLSLFAMYQKSVLTLIVAINSKNVKRNGSWTEEEGQLIIRMEALVAIKLVGTNFQVWVVATGDLSSAESGTRVEMPPTSSLQFLGHSLWTGTPGVAALWGFVEVESRGRTCPDRRDLGATEEQDEGSTGRSPNLHFCRKQKSL